MSLKPLASSIITALLCSSLSLGLNSALAQPPPATSPEDSMPAPVDNNGRVILGSHAGDENGVWTPVFGIFDPIAPLETVPFMPWSEALYEARQVHEMEPHARCKVSGATRQFLTPYGVEILELSDIGQIYIFDIGGPHTFRTIYTDGRSHPANFENTNYGHSIGWWEGDTLVVDSVGYNEDFWFGRRGLPHTDQLHTIEKFTRISLGRIDYRITIDDPGAYTAPFEGGFNLRWDGGQDLFEYVCQQANYADELMVGSEASSVDRSSSIIP